MTYTSLLNFFHQACWRTGRKLYCYARHEQKNDPHINGEYWLFQQYAQLTPNIHTILDIGANKGEWTQNALDALHAARLHARIHVFEPTRAAFALLSRRFSSHNQVSLQNFAVTQTTGTANMFVVEHLSGINSLHPTSGTSVEAVNAVSVDDYCTDNNIQHLNFVKSDVEGFDLSVLLGAQKLLSAGHCDIWQFEYNYRWIHNRTFLKDVFAFIEDKPYVLGKLYGNGVDIYEHWHPELERYFECNWVLVNRNSPLMRITRQARISKSNAAYYL